MKLTVTRKSHVHEGTRYMPGESFTGTEKLLKVFADRLEPATVTEAKATAAKADAAAKAPAMPKASK